MNRIASLRALLRDCFRKDELQLFLGTIDDGVVRAVTWEQGEALVFEDALSALQRYGVINTEFWNRLLVERGGRAEEIRQAQRAWNGRLAEDDISPGASLPPLVARRDDLFALRRELKAQEIPTSGLDEEIEDVERRLGLGVGLEVGATIAGVRLLEVLTHGPLGSSWRAWHVARKNEVRVRFASTSTVLMAHALTGLRHPNLLEIIPADAADPTVPTGTTLLVTEWVPSASLRDRTVPVPLTTALEWAAQIAAALRVVHDAGRAHGAISPDTVAVARDNSMRLVAPGLLTDGGVIGTIAPRDAHRRLVYTSPEAWTEPAAATPDADVYAVGMLLAWLLTGQEPLLGDADARAAWVRQIDAPESVRELLVGTTAGAADRVPPASLQERLDAATRWHQPVPEPRQGYLPAIHVVNGRLRDPFPPSVAWVAAHRQTIEGLLPSVGLLLVGSQQREAGVAVLVAPDLVAVPRHVVESVDFFLDEKERQAKPRVKLSPGTDLEVPAELSIRFSDPEAVRPVIRIAMIHPAWNLAFLRLDGSADRQPAPLTTAPPMQLDGGKAVVIGWPTRDRRMDEDVQSYVTGNTFNQKMVLPGQLLGLREQFSFSRKVESLLTYVIVGAGGGAPVIDLDAGAVAGFTFGAQYLTGSFSVPAWHLRRDPKVVSLGLSFLPSTDVVEPDPVVEEAWNPAPPAPTGALE